MPAVRANQASGQQHEGVPMKYELNDDEFNALSDDQKSAYGQSGDVYRLQVDGLPDIEALKSENERLKSHSQTLLDEKKAEAAKARQAEKEAADKAAEQAKSSGKLDEMEAAYQRKFDAQQAELQAIKQQQSQNAITTESIKLASELTTDPARRDLLVDQIKLRLRFEDGKVQVLDENGELTVSDTKQLVEQIKTAPRYAPLIDAPKGSGAPATGQHGSGAKKPSELTEAERIEFAKKDPEGFRQAFSK